VASKDPRSLLTILGKLAVSRVQESEGMFSNEIRNAAQLHNGDISGAYVPVATLLTTIFHHNRHVQRAGLWNPPTAAPTRSCHGERRFCNFSCAGGLSLCQPIGSSRPTPSTGPTAGTTPTRQPQHPRPQHHQPRLHGPPQELHAPVVTSISLLA
jgi:hypothetical protein